MTWSARLRLVAGLCLVLLVVSAATFVFNRRQTHVPSSTAEIAAARYTVGTDYGGLVVHRYVDEGDRVAVGDRLLLIDSPLLARDLAQGLVEASGPSLGADGTVTVRAAVAGTVSEIAIEPGAYASGGDVVATIDGEGSLHAEAEYVVTPRDLARIEDGAPVTLRVPDGTTLSGSLDDFTVDTVDGAAHVTARIDVATLTEGGDDALLRAGTPLEATLALRDDGPLAGVTDALGDLARRIGL